jgi:hypothetical protein
MVNNPSSTSPEAAGSQAQDPVLAMLAAGTKPEMLKMYNRSSVTDIPGGSLPQVPLPTPAQTPPAPAQDPRAGQAAARPTVQNMPLPTPPAPQAAQPQPQQAAPVLDEKDLSVPSFDETPQTQEAKPNAQEPQTQTPEPEKAEPELFGKEKSVADLRKVISKTNEELKAKSQELTGYQDKIKKYEAGEVIPEALKPKLDRVTQLEKYEVLHAFKTSEEYDSKFIKPLTGLTEAAKRLADDYRVDPAVIDRALKTTDKREQDRLLVSHFGDLGALEVKKVIGEMGTLQSQMAQAEAQPFAAFEAAKNEARLLRQKEVEAGIKNIEVKTKNAWINSVQRHSTTGEFPELMLVPGDDSHNQIVRPILERSSKELASMMKVLVAHGVKDLPSEIVEILADRFQRSDAYSTVNQQRNELAKHNYELQQQSMGRSGLRRPSLGGSNSGGMPGVSAPTAEPKMSIQDIIAKGNQMAAEKMQRR